MPEDPHCASSSAATLPPPDTVPPTPSLSALVPLVDDLAKAVTCPICLEYMEDAKQLHCSHLFCAACVVRMLAMDNVRCAVCKEKTTKRMVRPAPVSYADVVKYLRVLEDVIVDADVRPRQVEGLNDGFGTAQNAALFGMHNGAQRLVHNVVAKEQADTPRHKRCYLCPKGVDAVAFGGRVTFGNIFPAAAEKKRSLFVHERCASFSEDVYEEGGRFQNVQKLVAKTNKIVCGRDACGRTRANIECAAEACRKRYHFPCAVVDGCALVEDGFKLFCTDHKDLAPDIDDKEFQKTLGSPEDATTKEHEDDCYICGSGGRMLMCDTCEHVAHPVCAGLKIIPEGEWVCCGCTGEKLRMAEEAKTPSTKSRGVKRKKAPAASPRSGEDVDFKPSRTPASARNKRARRASDGSKRYVIAHTGLRPPEKDILKMAAKGKRAMIRSDVDRRVTHMVIRARSVEDAPIRTMKLCKAIAARVPILCWRWIEDSAKAEAWVSITDYVHPLTWPAGKLAVFENLQFYFGWYTGDRDMRDDLMSVVTLGGGMIVSREPSVEVDDDDDAVLCVIDENGQQKGKKPMSLRDGSAGVKRVPSAWILDRCTKNRDL